MMHIAFCTDTNYIMPTGVAMISICENNKEEITFHLVITDEGTALDEVDDKVKPLKEIANQYQKKAEIYRMDAAKISSFVCSGAGYISTTAFARIFLPDLLPISINKVLYLDCDLVCDGNIRDLWSIELSENTPIGAVVDCNYASVSCKTISQIPREKPYFNSGVLLMNLDCWRRNNYVQLAISTAIEKKFPLLDQDLLNHLFYSSIKILPVRYNLQLVTLLDGIDNCILSPEYYDEIKAACENPEIIHYLSANKPWNDEYCPKREIWEKYKQKSIWKDINLLKCAARFDRTYIHREIEASYWSEPYLFKDEMTHYLRFFNAVSKFKNKTKIIKIGSFFLDTLSFFLEKVYSFKLRNR